MVKEIVHYVTRGVAGARGYKPKGVVIHNTWDNSSAQSHIERLRKMTPAQLEAGFAHVFVDEKDAVWVENPANKAWHVANTDGNANYIGIEVKGNRSTPKDVFLASEKNAFIIASKVLKQNGLTPNRSTVRLHSEFSATECPKRSMIEHCGYDSTYAQPEAVKNKLKDYFIAQIKAVSGTSTSPANPSKPAPSKPAPSNSKYYEKAPAKVKLIKATALRKINAVNGAYWDKKENILDTYKAGTVFVITGMKKSSGGTPRLVTQSGFLLTANKDYVVDVAEASKPAPAKPAPAQPSAGKLKAQKGTFTATTTVAIKYTPKVSATQVAKLTPGESVIYDGYIESDNYIWVRYLRSNGKYAYACVRDAKTNKAFGTFK